MRIRRSSNLPISVIASLWTIAAAAPSAFGAQPAASSASAPQPAADVVLEGAAVYTVDAMRSWAEAVAIRGEQIVYVGSSQGAQRFVGPRTRVVKLTGKMLLPGFQDAHVHPLWAGVEQLHCRLLDERTREQYARDVADCASREPSQPWIQGGGWTMPAFPNGIPTRHELDAVVADRPVFLTSKDGHSAWVNSKALELAGITRDTPDPERGRIDRDPTGVPIGSLQESAIDLVGKLVPPATPDEMRRGLKLAIGQLNALGITSLQEASVPLQLSPSMLDTYRDLDRSGELSARVVASLTWNPEQGDEQIEQFVRARRDYTQGRLRAHTVKIFQDGVVESRTASMLEPYLGADGGTGMSLVEPEALKRIATKLDAEGFQLHFHAIGDAAIRQVFDALEAARSANGARDSRHHLSHIELFHPDDIPRFRELGAVANFQPLWARADTYINDLTLPILPRETHRWLYPIHSVLRSGGMIAFGSDWSVSSANPLEEMEVAVRRADWRKPDEPPFIPEERIDLSDAIAAFTINAAYVNFHDDRTGSIEPGKLADLIVLDRNLFAVDANEISDAKVLLTLLGGRPVYGDWSAFGE
jgi:hypothetical protein